MNDEKKNKKETITLCWLSGFWRHWQLASLRRQYRQKPTANTFTLCKIKKEQIINKILIILFLIFLNKNDFGQLPFLPNDISKTQFQLPENIKKIIQYTDTTLSNVREYDKRGNEIFSFYRQYVGEFWNGKYIYIIYANIYNSQNRMTKSISLHSNAGYFITYYDYDTINKINSEYSIGFSNSTDSLINKNPFLYISKLASYADLISFNEIKQLEKDSIKRLQRQTFYNKSNRTIKEICFSEKSDTASTTFYYYNSDTLSRIVTFNKDFTRYRYNPFEVKYRYSDNNKLIKVKTGFDYKNNSIDTSDFKIYEYNKNNQVVNKYSKMSDFYSQGKRVFEFGKSEYKYNSKGQVIERVNSRTYPVDLYNPVDREKLFSIKKFHYNEFGYTIKETDYDCFEKTTEIQEYKYKYEYYIE